MIKIPFDQYQRYRSATDVINSYRSSGQKFNILEVGANAHRNLEKFLPEDKITYIDIDFPDDIVDESMIKGDATEMQFMDNSYDIVIALDVYEHIPNDRRNLFLSEINRVSKIGFIIGAPFKYKQVQEAEERVNALYKSLYGVDFIWLKEHIDGVLPDMERTRRYLDDNNITYVNMYHGNIKIWEQIMSMYFIATKNPSSMVYKEQIDKFYNEYIYPIDFENTPDNVYRSFIIGKDLAKNNIVHADMSEGEQERRIELENKLMDLNCNFRTIINQSGNTSEDINEYIEVFADDQIIKMPLTKEEIIVDNVMQKFIKINKTIIKHGLRVDPCNKNTLIKIDEIFIVNEDKIEVAEYTTTASIIEGKTYYFDKDDPQIQITNVIGKEITGLIVKFNYIKYADLNSGVDHYILEVINARIKEEQENNISKEKHMNVLNEQLTLSQQSLQKVIDDKTQLYTELSQMLDVKDKRIEDYLNKINDQEILINEYLNKIRINEEEIKIKNEEIKIKNEEIKVKEEEEVKVLNLNILDFLKWKKDRRNG